jgi:HEPN domain-containing protein
MSRSKNRHEAERWLQTAEEDLRAADVLMQGGSFAQACFYSQQSGEKAVKALWHLIDADPWGHSVQKLIMDFPAKRTLPDLERWIERAALLDKFYIANRCNSWQRRPVSFVAMKILHVVGARPNFMKIAPIMHAMVREPDRFAQILVHTGHPADVLATWTDIGEVERLLGWQLQTGFLQREAIR